ncbi:MAG TPA: hypothetical protein VFQ61_39060, partial [Polyangiaceae bacterium]|nr:hypothetical protein [Polyangiaceae bacterium]
GNSYGNSLRCVNSCEDGVLAGGLVMVGRVEPAQPGSASSASTEPVSKAERWKNIVGRSPG